MKQTKKRKNPKKSKKRKKKNKKEAKMEEDLKIPTNEQKYKKLYQRIISSKNEEKELEKVIKEQKRGWAYVIDATLMLILIGLLVYSIGGETPQGTQYIAIETCNGIQTGLGVELPEEIGKNAEDPKTEQEIKERIGEHYGK